MNKLKNIFKDKPARIEWLKSMIVGVSSSALDIFVMAAILYFTKRSAYSNFFEVFKSINSVKSEVDRTFHVVLATGSGFLFSFIFNYVLSVFFVFHYGNVGKTKKGFLKFMLFAFIGFLITTLGQFAGYNLLGLNLWLTKVIIMLIVFVFNFLTRKYYIFNIELIIDEENQINM